MPVSFLHIEVRGKSYDYAVVRVTRPGAKKPTTASFKLDEFVRLVKRAGGQRAFAKKLSEAAKYLVPDPQKTYSRQLREHIRQLLNSL